MAFPLTVNLSYGWEKLETSDQRHRLGTKGVLPDGRVFYYARNGTAAITTAGMLVDAGTALTVNAHDMDVPANANDVGTTAVSVEVPTTDLTKDQYADGYMIFNDGPGEGEPVDECDALRSRDQRHLDFGETIMADARYVERLHGCRPPNEAGRSGIIHAVATIATTERETDVSGGK